MSSERLAALAREKRLLLLLAGALAFFLVVAPRYFGSLDDPHFGPRLGLLRVHILTGALALLLGPVQFIGGIRRTRPHLHRWTGRLYLAGIAVGGATGLALSPFANGGVVGRVGFAGLSVAWLVTSGVAWSHIRARRIARHRRWMIRSYVVTLAFVWVRLILGAGLLAGVEIQTVFAVAAWASWVLPLLVLETVFARRRHRPATS